MVIDSNNISNTNTPGGKSKVAGSERLNSKAEGDGSAQNTAKGDSVSLSAEAQSIARLEHAVANTTEIDSSRVESVKASLQAGQYRIDPEAIASKLLDEQ